MNKLNGKIKVTYITLNELDSWLNYKFDTLEKTYLLIPEDIHLEDPVFLEFKEYSKGQSADTKTLEKFRDYIQERVSNYKEKFEIVYDQWFINTHDDKDTKKLIDMLKTKYFQTRGEMKLDSTALHDALLLQWIDKNRKDTNNSKIWLITLDTSLPSTLYKREETISITLDAFLQWVSPFIDSPSAEEAFSILIRNRFFPQEKVFDLKDFLVFHELEIRAKDLPPEDVEEAIMHLKNKFGRINISDSKSLSETSYELARFFADPSRRYKQEIRKAYEKQEEIEKDYKEKLGVLSKQIEEIKAEYENKLKEKDRKLFDFQKRLEKIEKEREKEMLKNSALKRFGIVVVLTFLIEGAIIYFINKYGSGANLFQKLTNSSWWLALGIPIFIGLGWFIIGKKRLITLGWLSNKIFKMEEK